VFHWITTAPSPLLVIPLLVIQPLGQLRPSYLRYAIEWVFGQDRGNLNAKLPSDFVFCLLGEIEAGVKTDDAVQENQRDR
jgi:hypothetical protein